MIVKSEYLHSKPVCYVPTTIGINPSTTTMSQLIKIRLFTPLRIISDFMFYTFLSPYKIYFDKTSGDFGMRTYFWHKVIELARTNLFNLNCNET
jgi:hypothetical protein